MSERKWRMGKKWRTENYQKNKNKVRSVQPKRLINKYYKDRRMEWLNVSWKRKWERLNDLGIQTVWIGEAKKAFNDKKKNALGHRRKEKEKIS